MNSTISDIVLTFLESNHDKVITEGMIKDLVRTLEMWHKSELLQLENKFINKDIDDLRKQLKTKDFL